MDEYRKGILKRFNFAFLIADISEVSNQINNRINASANSAELLSKVLMGSFFLAGMVKDRTKVSIQLEGIGPIERILAYSSRDGRLKGLVKNKSIQNDNDPTLGIGTGVMRVIRWEESGHSHQSVTKLENKSFEENLLDYIHDSDQVTSFLSIYQKQSEAGIQCTGLILQALPEADKEDIHLLKIQLSKVDNSILAFSSIEDVLIALSKNLETEYTILEAGKPEFFCGCSKEKMRDVILSLGESEIESIHEEIGFIEIECEFCREKYQFNKNDLK